MAPRATKPSTVLKPITKSEREKRSKAALKGAATKRRQKLEREASSTSQIAQAPSRSQTPSLKQSTANEPIPSPSRSSRNGKAIADNEGGPDEASRKSWTARSQWGDHRLHGSLERQQIGSDGVAFQATAQQMIPLDSSIARTVSSQTQRNDQAVAQAELHERDVMEDFGVHKDTFEMPENFFENDPAVIKSLHIDKLKELRDILWRDAVDHEMIIRIGWLIEELRSERVLLTLKPGMASLFQ